MNIMKNVPVIESFPMAIAAPVASYFMAGVAIYYTYDEFISYHDKSIYSGIEYVVDKYVNPVMSPLAAVVALGISAAATMRSYEYFHSHEHVN